MLNELTRLSKLRSKFEIFRIRTEMSVGASREIKRLGSHELQEVSENQLSAAMDRANNDEASILRHRASKKKVLGIYF